MGWTLAGKVLGKAEGRRHLIWNGTHVVDDRGGIDVSIVDLEKGK